MYIVVCQRSKELRMKTFIESIINAINNLYKKTKEKGICNILQL